MKIAALDIGGTAIKSGIWDGSHAWDVQEWEANAKRGGTYLMERVKKILREQESFDAIGISTAGQVNTASGTICYANENIPGYTGMQVQRILEREFEVPVTVENDVRAAAVGEMQCGAAVGLSNFLCLTYGTGIGGAIVLERRLYGGSRYAGGNFGCILTHPEDRLPGVAGSGCYEQYASVTALVKKARKIDGALTDGRKILAVRDKPEIAELLRQWAREAAFGLVTLVAAFDPADLVLGGGILEQDYILGLIRSAFEELAEPSQRYVRLHQARLGNQAGMIGAAVLAEERFRASYA